MVPQRDEVSQRLRSQHLLKWWVRGALLGVAAAVVGIFIVAVRLKPYDAAGRPLLLGAHQQLGLPACRFLERFGRPCPTCGMTTSIALFMHGDVVGSFQANCAGTLLALWLVISVPWWALSAIKGYWLFGDKIEAWLLWGLIAIVLVAAVRWGVCVGWPWVLGTG